MMHNPKEARAGESTNRSVSNSISTKGKSMPAVPVFQAGKLAQRKIKLVLEEEHGNEWDKIKGKKVKDVIAYELRSSAGGKKEDDTHGRHIIAAELIKRYLKTLIIDQNVEKVGNFFVYGGTPAKDKNLVNVEEQIDTWARKEISENSNIQVGAAKGNLKGGGEFGKALGAFDESTKVNESSATRVALELLQASFDFEAANEKVEKGDWEPKDFITSAMKAVEMVKILLRKKATDLSLDVWGEVANRLTPELIKGYKNYLIKSKLTGKEGAEMMEEINKDYREGKPKDLQKYRRGERETKAKKEHTEHVDFKVREEVQDKMEKYKEERPNRTGEQLRQQESKVKRQVKKEVTESNPLEPTLHTPVKFGLIKLDKTPALTSPFSSKTGEKDKDKKGSDSDSD
jgi:hypothetical protein